MSDRRRLPSERGFSLLELMIAMGITLVLMGVVFAVMRQNQGIFSTQSGVTAMNENVRAAVDLISREIQAAGTGLRGMTAPILGVDAEGDYGDRVAILLGDPVAPIARVRPNSPWANGRTRVALIPPAGLDGTKSFDYRDDRGKTQQLYKQGDRYVLYNEGHFVIVRISGASWAANGDVLVEVYQDKSNPKVKFGDYTYNPAADGNGALFARLDSIVYYRYNKDAETLERRENHEPWADVARGVIGFKVRYRVLGEDRKLSNPLDEPPGDLEDIRSVVVTLRARTPDAAPGTSSYRETAETFEVTPRNMRISRANGDVVAPPPS
jgi:prepilin-type N-terminal cleavage/methylation domain-containing protein